MKNLLLKSVMLFFVIAFTTTACKKEDVVKNESTNVPATFLDRATEIQDKVNLSKRTVTLKLWDHGTIDGDIVSVYINGKLVVDEITLDGPSAAFTKSVTLDFNGYNYILLYAHNEGSISPNTASLEINDGTAHDVSLESDLFTSGVAELVVN